MSTPKSYKDLLAWQKAMDFVDAVYVVTRTWPRTEVFALTQQLHKSAHSVPSNIAEGYGRFSAREFVRYLQIAHGSLLEAETQLLIGQRQGFSSADALNDVFSLHLDVSRLIRGLIRHYSKPPEEQPSEL